MLSEQNEELIKRKHDLIRKFDRHEIPLDEYEQQLTKLESEIWNNIKELIPKHIEERQNINHFLNKGKREIREIMANDLILILKEFNLMPKDIRSIGANMYRQCKEE